MSAFVANTLNSIIKSAIFFFPCLKVSIFHSVSAAFVLSLSVALISQTNSSQSWVFFSSSSSSSFLCTYIPTTSPLRQARIAVILSLVSVTLLLLRNNLILFYQSLNFIQLLPNYFRSSTMLLGIIACTFSLLVVCAGVSDIFMSVCSYLFEASSVICRDSSYPDNASILFIFLELILVPLHSFHYTCFVPNR